MPAIREEPTRIGTQPADRYESAGRLGRPQKADTRGANVLSG